MIKRIKLHNFWNILREAERPKGDQSENGIFIQFLDKGDVLKMEMLRGNDGYAFRVTLEVIDPAKFRVKITKISRFIGGYCEKVEIVGDVHTVVADIVSYADTVTLLGWVGIGKDLILFKGDKFIAFRTIRKIFVNDSLIVFPLSSGTIH